MIADPFSDILRLANAQSLLSGGITAGGPWAIRFPSLQKMKFFAIVKGNFWLRIDGEDTPVRIEKGDVFLLSAQCSFVAQLAHALAERALREGSTPLSALALSLGDTSESAFSNAFKRTRGMAPKRFRDSVRGLSHNALRVKSSAALLA